MDSGRSGDDCCSDNTAAQFALGIIIFCNTSVSGVTRHSKRGFGEHDVNKQARDHASLVMNRDVVECCFGKDEHNPLSTDPQYAASSLRNTNLHMIMEINYKHRHEWFACLLSVSSIHCSFPISNEA